MLSLRRISLPQLAGDRIRYRGLGLVASPGFCLRTSSMTFSRASLSACDVEDVAATAAGATCLRGDGKAGVAGGSQALELATQERARPTPQGPQPSR